MKERDREAQWLLYEKYSGKASPEYFEDLKSLESGEPLGYLIGYVPFLQTTIHLDSRPLIPRPETEYWTEKAISTMAAQADSLSVLDLCAGSGCIGIAVLKSLPNAKVDFAEIDVKHHKTILKNLEVNGINKKRVRIYGGDLFEKIEGTYDSILSNPPYIDADENTVDPQVAAHEPARALYGGRGGTEIIEAIIKDAPAHLNTVSTLYLEHEPSQARHIETFAAASGLSASVQKDQYGIDRFSLLTRN